MVPDQARDTPTTTSTTTTLAPTTTALATTTEFDAGSVTLPPTGDDPSTDIALAALGMLLGGAGLLLSRR